MCECIHVRCTCVRVCVHVCESCQRTLPTRRSWPGDPRRGRPLTLNSQQSQISVPNISGLCPAPRFPHWCTSVFRSLTRVPFPLEPSVSFSPSTLAWVPSSYMTLGPLLSQSSLSLTYRYGSRYLLPLNRWAKSLPILNLPNSSRGNHSITFSLRSASVQISKVWFFRNGSRTLDVKLFKEPH